MVLLGTPEPSGFAKRITAMKNITSCSCRSIVLILGFVAGVVPVAAQNRQMRVQSTPIRELLRPDDKTVTITSLSTPPSGLAPGDGESTLEWMIAHSNVVVVIRVDEKKSYLTPQGNWISTTATATAEQVFVAPPDSSIRRGARLSFFEEGDTMSFGDVTVHGVEYWRRPTVTGGRYLAFTEMLQLGKFVLIPRMTYELVGSGGLPRMLANRQYPNDDIQASYEADIIARISRHLSSKP
jgi:hypothetical protein